MVTATWRETAMGQALYLGVEGHEVAFLSSDLEDAERAAYKATISLWEGIAGIMPRSFLARWRWNHGAQRLHRSIARAIKEAAYQSE